MTTSPALITKRIIDVVVAATGLVVASPVFAAVSLAIRFQLGSPIVFSQVRPGYLEKPIRIRKFRTMTDARGPDGELLPDDQRLTPLGRFLRRTSLDELPELYNVLVGDMSLVGPRPLLTRYLPFYTPRERLRHSIRPGITGYAQISGRNTTPWTQRLELDVWYVEHWSLALDLRILAGTALKVVTRQGIVDAPNTVMLDFDEERATDRNGPYSHCNP